MDISLTAAEARVLGCLVEKEATTPEGYPLSLNALTNACNQRSNRHPVMDLNEQAVREALHGLEQMGLASAGRGSDGRVPKYEHHLQERFNFRRGEIAVLCTLLLRGAQTPGELRGRSERLHPFGDLDEVHSALQRLMEREPPLVRSLAREPGTKEARYVELLSAASAAETPAVRSAGKSTPEQNAAAADSDSVARLQGEVRDLAARLAEVEAKLERLLAQLT